MGLYLAREMATDLGLKLYAVSEYREGLTMKVQIPIVDRPCVPGSDCGVLPGRENNLNDWKDIINGRERILSEVGINSKEDKRIQQ